MALAVLEVEPDCAEVEAVGIDTEVLRGFLVSSALFVFNGINLLMAVPEVEGLFSLRHRQVAGVFEPVPAPV